MKIPQKDSKSPAACSFPGALKRPFTVTSAAIMPLVLTLSSSGQPCVNWVHRTDVGTPGQRAHHAMAYDSDRGVTVFFGGEIGETGSETYYNDTWEYDGNHWTQIQINGTNPPARSFHAMAYDPNFKRVVLMGGQAGGTAFSDFWAYEHTGANATWTWLGNDAPLVAGHAMVYSTRYNSIESHGGATRIYGSSGFSLKNGWLLAGTLNWTNLNYSSQAYGIGVAYDTLRRAIVGVGGYTQPDENGLVSAYFAEWAISEDPNTEQYPTNILAGPLARAESSVAYDSSRDRTVCVGGVNGITGTENEVWEYSPSTGWYQGTYLVYPYGRAGAAMVYDSKRRVMVLMGGAGVGAPNSSSGGRFDDTWEYTPDTAPSLSFPATGTLCRNQTLSITPNVTSDRPLTYQWYINDPSLGWTPLYYQTNQTLNLPPPVQWRFLYGLTLQLDEQFIGNNGQTLLAVIATDACGSPYAVTQAVNVVEPPLNTPFQDLLGDGLNTNNDQNAGTYFACIGDSINFNANNLYPGNITNVSYQWYRSGLAIPGGSVDIFLQPSLDLTNVQPVDTGDYYVRIFNSCGYCESPHVHLQVGVTISQQPLDQHVNPCQPAYFSVTAQGVGTLHYQWRFKGVPLTNDANHAGVTTSTLTVAPTLYDLEGPYDCVISDDCGAQDAVTSAAGTLALPPPIWVLRPSNGPAPRYANAMIYDSKRAVTVLYGGGYVDPIVGYRGYGEVWEWNGLHWSQRTGYLQTNVWHQNNQGYWVQSYGDTPAARLQHAMAYDSRRGRVVMFGGRGGPNGVYGDFQFNDTWEWDGSRWYFCTTNGPSGRFDHHLGYDPVRGVTVLYGGFGATESHLWEWNGTNWSALSPTNGASVSPFSSYNQDEACQVFDTYLNTLFVGPTDDGFGYNHFYWTWDGHDWHSRALGFLYGYGFTPAKGNMVYDTYRFRSLRFGGLLNGTSESYGGTATGYYDSLSDSWSVLPDEAASSVFHANDFVDITSLAAKLGAQADLVSQYLWTNLPTSDQQTLTNSSATPDQKKNALTVDFNTIISNSVVYASNRFAAVMLSPETVLFRNINPQIEDLVRFNRLLLEDAYPAEIARSPSFPPGRYQFAMAFDSARRAAVVMGGQYGGGTYATPGSPSLQGDTWELIYVDMPMISSQPASQYRAPGDTAVFNIDAHGPVGSTLSYAWYFGNTPLSDGGRISGSHSATLKIANVNGADAGQYVAFVSDQCGQIRTAPAILTTNPSLQIFSAANAGQLVWAAANLVLQEADSVNGPWTTVLGASSPFDFSFQNPNKFFRLNTNAPAGP